VDLLHLAEVLYALRPQAEALPLLDSALAALERLHMERISSGMVWNYLGRPEFDRVRASPRFRRLADAWRPVGVRLQHRPADGRS
jgi:hypothetical protein